MSEKKENVSRKRSKITTNSSPTEFYLTSQGVCEIIKQCGESGVSEFTFGQLRISFQASKDECQDHTYEQSLGKVTANTQLIDEDSFLRQDEAEIKEEEIVEIKLQDPLEYENLLAQQEFESGEQYAES